MVMTTSRSVFFSTVHMLQLGTRQDQIIIGDRNRRRSPEVMSTSAHKTRLAIPKRGRRPVPVSVP